MYLAVCVVLVSLNLRTLFSSFSAILPEITAATGLPGWGATVLTTVPATLLGVFAPLAPVLARRFGSWRVLFGALLLTGASGELLMVSGLFIGAYVAVVTAVEARRIPAGPARRVG